MVCEFLAVRSILLSDTLQESAKLAHEIIEIPNLAEAKFMNSIMVKKATAEI